MSFVKKTFVIAASSIVAATGVLAVEVFIARGTKRLEGYSRAQLDGFFGRQTEHPLRVAWLGDSTGQGVGATDPSHVLSVMVAAGLARPIQLSVLAISGARASDVVRTQLPELRSLHPDWVIVCIGGNDVTHLTSRPAFRRSIDTILTEVHALQPKHVIVVGIGPFASTPLLAEPLRWIAGIRGSAMDSDLRHAAKRYGALYVSIIERVGKAFADDPARYHAVDGFHPSNDGYALWARAILDSINEAGW